MTLAKLTCLDCGLTWTKNCSFGCEAEREFYLNERPRCPSCKTADAGIWKIEELLEVRGPLSEYEKDLFSLAGGFP